MFLWPVFLLLFYRACYLWPSPQDRGIYGCYVARPEFGTTSLVEESLEAVLQPKQAGSVGGECVI